MSYETAALQISMSKSYFNEYFILKGEDVT